MNDSTFNVILTGELEEGVVKKRALEAFAKLFRLPAEKAEMMFSKAPVIIKKSVDGATAHKFIGALKKAGLVCELREVGVPSAANATAHDSPAKPSAPVEKEKINQPGYAFEMAGQPDYGYVTVQIPADKMLKVEASAMATMDTNIRMKTKMRGGFGRLLSGENIFINEFTAEEFSGEVGIAPGTPGDLKHEYLNNQTIYLQNSAFVACGPEVNIESKWQGLVKGFFSGESLFLIRASGKGDLWFNSYGAIIEIDVEDDYVVDTGNIVAFTEGMEYDITKVGGYKSLFFSGEGFVCRFRGQGKVWIQTRGTAAFVGWAHWFRPVKKKG